MRLIVGSILLVILISGCKQDPCDTRVCENGSCVNGICECEPGYEGVRCELAERDKFLGEFRAVYTGCVATSPNHVVTVEVAPDNASQVRVLNLGDYACPAGQNAIVADIRGDSLIIGNQTINCGAISYTFQGLGLISGSAINLSFSATYFADPQQRTDQCSVVLERN